MYKVGLLLLILGLTSCDVQQMLSTDSDVTLHIRASTDDTRLACDCGDKNHYRPDSRYPVLHVPKQIRVNVHFINSPDSSFMHNGQAARDYARYLITDANLKLSQNVKMALPEGNKTPVYEIGLRLLLAEHPEQEGVPAVYEHIVEGEDAYFVNKGTNRNNFDQTLIKKYAVDTDTMINIFAMGHHPDSVASRLYPGGIAGISFGSSVKIAGINEHGLDAWRASTLLNHEIGHSLGLRHSWYRNDGCDDTPPNPNCWHRTGRPPCDGPNSNNMMDYNNSQMAVTPCQIGIMHKHLYYKGARCRKYVVEDHCYYNPERSLVVTDTLLLNREYDAQGDVIVKDGGYLRLSCRLHMPLGGRIIVEPNATLDLNGCEIYNDCGESWYGFKIVSKGSQQGTVIYRGDVKIKDIARKPKFTNHQAEGV